MMKPTPMVCARATAIGGSTLAHTCRRTIHAQRGAGDDRRLDVLRAGDGQRRRAGDAVEQRRDEHAGDQHRLGQPVAQQGGHGDREQQERQRDSVSISRSVTHSKTRPR